VKREPRSLLEEIPGIELLEMEEPEACCGFGGSFSLSQYDLSVRINEEKMEDIERTEAREVVMGCPGCLLHMQDGLSRRESPIRALHTMEVLERAYRRARE